MKKSLLILLAAALILSCQGNRQSAGPSFDDVIASRRSIRSFDAGKTLSEAEIRTLVEAAQEAPSWTNSQPSRYYAALSREKADAVREALWGRNRTNTEGAAAFIISTFVKGQSGFFRGEKTDGIGDGWGAYDNGLSNAYLILKARAMGFDTLIMGGRDEDKLRTCFDIPDDETILAVIALGYRAEDPVRPPRKPLDEILKVY